MDKVAPDRRPDRRRAGGRRGTGRRCRRDRAAPRRASTCWSSTRRSSPATSAAATGSPRSPCVSWSTSASTGRRAVVPAGRRAPCCAARPGGRSRCRCRTGHGLFAAVDPTARARRRARRPRQCQPGVTVLQGHGLEQLDDRWRRRRGGRRGARHRSPPDTSSPPTGCGARRARRSALDVDGYLGEWHAFRQYVDGVTGPAADRLIVWFDDDFLPGYAWSFPLPGGRANVGFGIRARHRPAHTGHGADVGRRSSSVRTSPRPSGPAPRPSTATSRGRSRLASTRRRSPRGPVLFAGDAAGATDVMTGEGIGQALLTGRLAAAAIVAGGDVAPCRYRHDRARRAGGRPPHVGAARPGARPPRAAPTGRSRILDHAGGVGPPQLRPLDVRGRAAGDRPSRPAAGTVASCVARRSRRSRPHVVLRVARRRGVHYRRP